MSTNTIVATPRFLRPKSECRTPDRVDAEQALRSILRYVGEDPDREGLLETPSRFVRALDEHFAGYSVDPGKLLCATFAETDGYDEMVLLRAVRFHSHCEHHIAPIVGRAWVAYMPRSSVVGISKLARLVQAYAKRLQIQERMTVQIADTLERELDPKGVAVVIKAEHLCMTTRGVLKPGTDLVTRQMRGCFRDDLQLRNEFFAHVEQETATQC